VRAECPQEKQKTAFAKENSKGDYYKKTHAAYGIGASMPYATVAGDGNRTPGSEVKRRLFVKQDKLPKKKKERAALEKKKVKDPGRRAGRLNKQPRREVRQKRTGKEMGGRVRGHFRTREGRILGAEPLI